MKIRNVLLVGMGRISSKHIDAIEAHPSLKLWGVCDAQPGVIQKFANTGLKIFSSIEQALVNCSDVDLAVILTYSGDHPEHCEAFLRAGIPVITEKPLALSLGKARAIAELSESLEVPAFVVKQNRLNPAVRTVLSAVREGELGDLLFVSARVFWCRPESYYRDGGWRMRKDQDGGVIWNQASHYVDLLGLFMDDVTRLRAIGRNFLSPADTLDTVFVQLENSQGVLGTLEATTAIRPTNFEGSMTFCGSKGTIKIGGHALNQIEHWGLSSLAQLDTNHSGAVDLNDVYGSSHLGVYESVVDHLNGLEPSQFAVRNGLFTVAIMEAIDRSIETNSVVPVEGC